MMPALEQHKAKLLLAAAAGRLPDVASIDSFWLPLFLEGGHLQPLNPYWPAEDRADFLPFTIDTLSDRRGNIYGVWHETDCRALFYRKDLVPVPPETWDELIDDRRAASRRSAASPAICTTPADGKRTVFDHLPMFWAQGGELVDARRPPRLRPAAASRSPDPRADVPARHGAAAARRRARCSASNDYKQLSAAAIAGDVAMFLGGNWQIRELKDALSPEEFAKWAIAPIPQYRAGPAPTGTGGWIWVVFSQGSRRSGARPRSSSSTSRRRQRRAHQRGDRASSGAAERVSRLPGLSRGAVRVLRQHARRGPGAPGGAHLQRDLARAADSPSATRSKAREHRRARRGRSVSRRRRRGRQRRTHVAAGERRSIRWRGSRRCSRLFWLAWSRCAQPRGRAPRLAGADGRARRALPAVSDARARPHRVHRSRRARRTVPLHACTDFRSLAGDPQFYGMIGVTLVFVGASVALQLGARSAAGVAVRCRGTASRDGRRSRRASPSSARG